MKLLPSCARSRERVCIPLGVYPALKDWFTDHFSAIADEKRAAEAAAGNKK
jgi:hypothetical protein